MSFNSSFMNTDVTRGTTTATEITANIKKTLMMHTCALITIGVFVMMIAFCVLYFHARDTNAREMVMFSPSLGSTRDDIFFHSEFVLDGIVGAWRSYTVNSFFLFDDLVTYNVCCVVDQDFICMTDGIFDCKMGRLDVICMTKDACMSYARCVISYTLSD